MEKVVISEQVIASESNKRCIDAFRRILSSGASEPSLRIVAEKEVFDADLTFFSYLFMFQQQKPDLKIVLELRGNRNDDARVIVQFRQFCVYAYLVFGRNGVHLKTHSSTFKNHQKALHSPSLFVTSSSFLPFIFVGVDSNAVDYFKFFFENASGFERYLKSCVNYLSSGGVSSVLATSVISRVAQRQSTLEAGIVIHRQQRLYDLSCMAFIRALDNAKILRAYFYRIERGHDDPELATTAIRIGNLTVAKHMDYFESVCPIFDELRSLPPIYSLVFSLLSGCSLSGAKAADRNALTTSNKLEYAAALMNLWAFTKELVYGVRELAKNIVEHSTYKQGLITMRLHRPNDEDPAAAAESRIFETYNSLLAQPERNIDAVVKISVLDLGDKGVSSTLVDSLDRQRREADVDSPIRNLLEEDLGRLRAAPNKLKFLLEKGAEGILNVQAKRAMAHFGLVALSNLVKKNRGVVTVASGALTERETSQIGIASDELAIAEDIGTAFNIYFPVSPEHEYAPSTRATIQFPALSTAAEIKRLQKLLSYQFVRAGRSPTRPSGAGASVMQVISPQLTDNSRAAEQELWAGIRRKFEECRQLADQESDTIFCVDFEGVSLDGSQLFRFLGSYSLEFSTNALLVTNISRDLLLDLVRLNQLFMASNISGDYWTSNEVIGVFSYIDIDRGSRFYFSDVLWGRSREQFLHLNALIARSQFNAIANSRQFEMPGIRKEDQFQLPSSAVADDNVLLPFDLLIESRERKIFEYNSAVVLCNEVKPASDYQSQSLAETIQNLPGFKISNTHFKLGSKIHISDFYYAKRYFQNGYFASRTAFCLAQDIAGGVLDFDLGEMLEDGLTVVGYGQYSDLFLSLLIRFLNGVQGQTAGILNYDIVSDTQELAFVKGAKINKNVLIVVPIASTFSTAIKIQNHLAQHQGDRALNIISPHINIFYISNERPANGVSELERSLGWVSKDISKREVVIRSSAFDLELRQKYYWALETKWYDSYQCGLCFPNELANEKALFRTDKVSVTPALIFENPRGRRIGKSAKRRQIELRRSSVKYGHSVRNRQHYLYAIDTIRFLEDNRERVETYLRTVCKRLVRKKSYSPLDRVVIVSPCHYSNSLFIDLVNRIVFSGSANIIHYDPSDDFIENFRLIYGAELSRANMIVFVDDSIKSGSAFQQFHAFVQHAMHARGAKSKDPRVISHCITLINKMQNHTSEYIRKLLRKKGRFFCFANMHFYGPDEYGQQPALEMDRSKWLKLAENSALDSLRKYYFKKHRSLDPQSLDANVLSDKPTAAQLFFIKVTHDIFEYFSTHDQDFESVSSIDEFAKAIFASSSVIVPEYEEGSRQTHEIVLKVMTYPPFTYYRNVRLKAIQWALQMLCDHMASIEADRLESTRKGSAGYLDYVSFQRLKYIAHRLCLLDSTSIISVRWLEFIRDNIFHEDGIDRLVMSLEKQDISSNKEAVLQRDLPLISASSLEIRDLQNFGVYLVAQIKELVHTNSARSLRLQNSLVTVEAKSGNWRFRQLVRMLHVENSLMISEFLDYVSEKSEWRFLYGKKNTDSIVTCTSNIATFLRTKAIEDSPQYVRLEKFLAARREQQPPENAPFLWFLWISHYLQNDVHTNRVAMLSQKTEHVMSALRLIIRGDLNGESVEFTIGNELQGDQDSLEAQTQVCRIGCFFIANNIREKPLVVFAEDEFNREYSISSGWHSNSTTENHEEYLNEFMRGDVYESGNYNKSIIELERCADDPACWIDIYAKKADAKPKKIHEDFVSKKCDRLMLIRLDKDPNSVSGYTSSVGANSAQGVLGFFFKNESAGIEVAPELRGARSKQLLLLLRRPLSQFIRDHHESNEFVEWTVASKKQELTVLSSHGQGTLDILVAHTSDEKIRHRFSRISTLQKLLQTGAYLHDGIGHIESSVNDYFKSILEDQDLPSSIAPSYFFDLESLVSAIFGSKYAEREVDVRVEVSISLKEPIEVHLSANLFDFIFYELMINAKKNRWDYVGDEDPGELVRRFPKNTIRIEVRKDGDNFLCIRVSNTGPEVDLEYVERLNESNIAPKQIGAASGIQLVRNIVLALDGLIEFDCENLRFQGSEFAWFSVNLKFKLLSE